MSSDDPNYRPYFSEIEDVFIRRRGKSLLLSPLDWALIESWHERGVPLHVVTRSIEEVFDNHKSAARRRGINSLRYCQSEVESQFAEYLESRVGAHSEPAGDGESVPPASAGGISHNPFSKDAIDAHLVRVTSILQSQPNFMLGDRNLALTYAFKAAVMGIHVAAINFSQGGTVAKLEEELTQIEGDLTSTIHEAATSNQMNECREKVETALADYARSMTAAAYQQTFDTLLNKHLRELFGVPRLSLFHMK